MNRTVWQTSGLKDRKLAAAMLAQRLAYVVSCINSLIHLVTQ